MKLSYGNVVGIHNSLEDLFANDSKHSAVVSLCVARLRRDISKLVEDYNEVRDKILAERRDPKTGYIPEDEKEATLKELNEALEVEAVDLSDLPRIPESHIISEGVRLNDKALATIVHFGLINPDE